MGGGVLAWLGCHWLDALRFVTGEEIVRVQAELATTSGESIDVEDTAAVSFRTSGGAVGSLHAGYLLAVGNPGYRAAGHDIALILRGTLGATLLHRRPTRSAAAPGERRARLANCVAPNVPVHCPAVARLTAAWPGSTSSAPSWPAILAGRCR